MTQPWSEEWGEGRETYSFYFSYALFMGGERKREASHSDSQGQTNFLCASDGL